MMHDTGPGLAARGAEAAAGRDRCDARWRWCVARNGSVRTSCGGREGASSGAQAPAAARARSGPAVATGRVAGSHVELRSSESGFIGVSVSGVLVQFFRP